MIHSKLRLLTFLWLVLLAPSLVSCQSQKSKDSITATDSVHNTPKKVKKLVQKKAVATYYSDKLNGKRTASGAIFNNNKQTCAHRTLPFGTVLKVTNIETKKWVEVVVTDRGPHTKGRDIDLTKKAFMLIAPKNNKGKLNVRIEIFED